MGRILNCVLFLVLATALTAQSTWTGTTSSAWNVGSNWSPAGVPTAITAVVIPNGVPNVPSTAGVINPTCADLTLQPGATLNLASGVTLIVNGSVSMAGTCLGAGVLRLAGSGTVSTTGVGAMPATEFLNSGGYTLNCVFAGNMAQFAGGQPLTIQNVVAQQAMHFLGAPFVGGPNSTLDVGGVLDVQPTAPVIAPPPTILLRSQWLSNAQWQPASGKVICSGTNGVVLQVAPNTHWAGFEIEAGGASLLSDLFVDGALRVRSSLTVTGTTIDLGAVAGITFPSALVGANVTTLRIRGGIQSAGSVLTPNALLDADGDVNFFVSGVLQLGAGTHRISDSFTVAGNGFWPLGSTFIFDGSGSISANEGFAQLPNVQITGSNYTILRGKVAGTLTQTATSGNLNILSCEVVASCSFLGASVQNFLAGSLLLRGPLNWATSTVCTNPPATITALGSWTSTSSFNPASGLVILGATGAQPVTMAAFHWHDLRVSPTAIVSTPLAVDVDGFLDVRGSLTSNGSSVDVGGVLTVPGTMQANLATSFLAHNSMAVAGSLQATGAALDVDGDANITGSVAIGNGGHVLSNSVFVSGSLSVPLNQTVTFDGSGQIDIITTSALPNVVFSGSDYDVVQLSAAQNLTMTSGAMNVQLCRVQGNALLQGDAVLDLNNGLFDVAGNINWLTTTVVNTPPATIECGGNWNSTGSFQPTSGLVFFDGTGAQSVTVPVFQWFNLRIGTSSSVSTAQNAVTLGFLDVLGSLACGGSSLQVGTLLTVAAGGSVSAPSATSVSCGGVATISGSLAAGAATLAAADDFSVLAGGTCVLGNGTHTFAADFGQAGTLTVPPTATFDFTGTGSIAAVPAFPLPLVVFSGGDYTVANLTAGGALTQTAGRLFIQNLRALSSATFQGNTIADSLGGQLVVDGALSLQTAGAIVTPPATIRVGGTFASNAQFVPTSGTVIMQGVVPQLMNAPLLALNTLQVDAGAQVSFSTANVILLADLTVNGAVQCPSGSLEVRGNLTVAPSGSMQLAPSGACTVAQNCTNAGAIAGTSALTMVGNGTLLGSGAFPRIAINATGEIAVNGTVGVGGDLAVLAGTLRLLAGATVNAASVNATGGTLRGAAGSSIVVTGGVTLDGVLASVLGVPDIRCAGAWRARSTYVPTTGSVVFTAGGQITSLGGPLTFVDLQLQSGVRTLTGNLTATAQTVAIATGSELALGSRQLNLTANTVGVNGTLSMASNSRLFLGAGTAVTVATSGALRIVGLWDAPAVVDGPVGGAYAFTINGFLEAMNFEFRHMGPAGIVVSSTATLAAVPRDLRGGLFADGDATSGSCLLHIDRSLGSPVELRYLRFENSSATATYNVRSTGADTVGIRNESGAFAIPTSENDPNNVINWLAPQHTTVTAVKATAAVHRTELLFTTTGEVDVQAFHIQRSTLLAGPYVDVFASIAPIGAPGATYTRTDLAVTDTTKYFYRVQEVLLHGEPRTFGTDFARPWPQSLNNTLFVGTNGGYPDIAAAVAAAVPGQNIVVQAGSYPAFTIDRPVRIMPDGSGVVNIDTTLAKLVIQNIPAGSFDMSLTGLRVGGATSPFGMEIVNCGNTIILQDLQVTTAATTIGLKIDSSDRITIQNSTFTGNPGLRIQNNSLAYLSRGSIDALDVQSNSTVTICDVTPGSLTSSLGTTVNQLPGEMPNMAMKPVWPGEKPVPLTITAPVNTFYAVIYSLRRDFVDLSPVFPIDMVLLLDHTLFATALSGLASPSGTQSFNITAPGVVVGWGQSLPLQLLTLNVTGFGRMGTALDVVFVP